MVELECFEVGGRTTGGKTGACDDFALVVADFEEKGPPATDVGDDDIENRVKLISVECNAWNMVRSGNSIDEDVKETGRG
jgi:hypothetical protein